MEENYLKALSLPVAYTGGCQVRLYVAQVERVHYSSHIICIIPIEGDQIERAGACRCHAGVDICTFCLSFQPMRDLAPADHLQLLRRPDQRRGRFRPQLARQVYFLRALLRRLRRPCSFHPQSLKFLRDDAPSFLLAGHEASDR